MSAIIIETYIRHVTGRPLDVEAQLQKHRMDWAAQEPMRELIKRRMEALEAEKNAEPQTPSPDK